jgi:hypothetical protein
LMAKEISPRASGKGSGLRVPTRFPTAKGAWCCRSVASPRTGAEAKGRQPADRAYDSRYSV